MVGRTAPIRPIDEHRFEVIREHCGCLTCLIRARLNIRCTVEHVTDAGRRVGGSAQHQYTVGLCEWCHLGWPPEGMLTGQATTILGPSLANGRKPFEEAYGDELLVLIPTQDWLIRSFDETPWRPYNIPLHVARDAQELWTQLYAETSR